MSELTQFQAQAANVALNTLLSGRSFSICDLDSIAKLIGVELGGRDYQALRVLHCVSWADMPEPLRQQTREKVVEILGLPPVIIEGEKVESAPTHKSPKLKLAFWK